MLGLLALGLLALVAELAGRSLTHRLDVGRHVTRPGYASGGYYPFLLIAVKVALALLLAGIAWRFARERATARAAHRFAVALGAGPPQHAPRVRIELSPRLWLVSFAATASFYLLQSDAEQLAAGRWTLLAPWLHSSALPIFAVLAVLVAVVYGGVARWLADYECYARETADLVRTLAAGATLHTPRRGLAVSPPPRSLFGLAFESRPPPAQGSPTDDTPRPARAAAQTRRRLVRLSLDRAACPACC